MLCRFMLPSVEPYGACKLYSVLMYMPGGFYPKTKIRAGVGWDVNVDLELLCEVDATWGWVGGMVGAGWDVNIC